MADAETSAASAKTLQTVELVELIFTFLPLKDLVRVTRVCQTWKAVIFTSAVLRHDLLLDRAPSRAPVLHPCLSLTCVRDTCYVLKVSYLYKLDWKRLLKIAGPWRQMFLATPQCDDITVDYGWRRYDGTSYKDGSGEFRVQDEAGLRVGLIIDILQDLRRQLRSSQMPSKTGTLAADTEAQRAVTFEKIGRQQLFYFKNVTCRITPDGPDKLSPSLLPT